VPRWTVYVWAVVLALSAGVLIPAAMVGTLQPGPVALLAVLVATAAVATFAARTSRRVSVRRERLPTATPEQRVNEPEPGLTSHDWNLLGTLCGAVSSSQLEWMRSSAFITPWLDARVRALLELEPLLAALRERPFSETLSARLAGFSDALAPFAAFYTDHTFPDPLLLGTDWRFYDWNEVADAKAGASRNDLWNGRAQTMRSLATAVANAYAALREIAIDVPQVREHVRVAAPAYR
jgi:hypothetical protein